MPITSQQLLESIYGADATAKYFAEEAAPEPQRGVFAEAGSALGQGAANTMSSVAGTLEMLKVPGATAARQEWEAISQHPALQRPEYLQEGTVVEHPERLADWRWYVRLGGENITNMIAMMAPGLGAMKGAKVLQNMQGIKILRA